MTTIEFSRVPELGPGGTLFFSEIPKVASLWVKNTRTGERTEVTDNLYWFEENSVSSMSGESASGDVYEIYASLNDATLLYLNR